MAEKGKPPDAVPIVFGECVSLDSWSAFARPPLDDAIDRAFDAMLVERMRLLDEEIMGGVSVPSSGILNGKTPP